jgi:hypothetical protein
MAKRPDEELILLYYGEHPERAALERELTEDPELSRRYEKLRRDLRGLDTLQVPEPRPGLEGRMWARVQPELQRPRRRFTVPAGWPSWAAVAAGVMAVALVGFLAGRSTQPPPTEVAVVENLRALPPDARDRVLQAALADHLEDSQRLLLEVSNGSASLNGERAWAETLLSANRLYRRAALRAGQNRVAAMLAELEPLLTQLAESPESFDLHDARERIESADLLFKVTIARNNLKELS